MIPNPAYTPVYALCIHHSDLFHSDLGSMPSLIYQIGFLCPVYTMLRFRTEISGEVVQKHVLGWIVISRVACRRKWASFWKSTLLLVRKFTPEQLQGPDKVFEKRIAVAVPERCKVMESTGPWILFIGHCLFLCSTLRGRRRKAKQQALWPFKLQLTHKSNLC